MSVRNKFEDNFVSLQNERIDYGKGENVGALAGDIIGSLYEFYNTKSTDFELFTKWTKFTDDSVMTLAVAKWLMEDAEHSPWHLIKCMQELGCRYPRAGYGGHFNCWLRQENPQPYKSWGNGAGMRVSPVGLYAKTLDEALNLAEITASVSHNHPEGIRGAQAIATSVYLCKEGQSKQEIKDYVKEKFAYNLSRTIDEIRPNYSFESDYHAAVVTLPRRGTMATALRYGHYHGAVMPVPRLNSKINQRNGMSRSKYVFFFLLNIW
jgi:ADP-ribosylglycohydrolase